MPQQKIFTAEIVRKMLANSKATGEALINNTEQPDHKPVIKVFNPYGAATWLLTEIDEDGRCFGLCDLGQGYPELGYVMRSEIEQLRIGGYGLPLERDAHFTATKTLAQYAEDARAKRRIAA